MVHRLADEQRARVAKSSAGRSRRPQIPIKPRQGTSTSDGSDSTTAATTTSSDPSTTTTTTTTPQPATTSPAPTTTSTTPDPVTTTPTSTSDAPDSSSTSSSPLTTTTAPLPKSSTSPSGGSTTSVTTSAESSPSSTTPVSTPASTTPDPTTITTSSNPPASETDTATPGSSTPADSTSTPGNTAISTGGQASSVATSTAGPVITSGSIILSSASDVQVSFTTTNSLGQTTVDIPSQYTTTYTSTSNGIPLTVTAVVSQATTLNTDGGGSASPFFKNKGAVAGVFIVVGIAGAAIILFGIFTFLRRRKMRRLTREAAIAATLGSGRTPFVDDDDADASGPSGGNSTEMGYHSASDTRPMFGSYGTSYPGSYGYGPDPFYSNPPAGKSFNVSPPGSIDQHGPNNPQGLLPPVPYTYGPTGAPNLPPTTPLLSNNQAPTAPPASPPSVYSNMNAPKGYEYDYSNYVPPSAVDGMVGRTLSPSPTSPTFSKRSSLPLPPPGAAAPNYAALAAAAGLASDSGGLAPTNVPPSAYQGLASGKARRTSNTPSFASSASRYSVDPPRPDVDLVSPQTPGLPSYSAANVSKSNSGHSVNASTSNHSHGGPSTPAPDAMLGGDRGGLIHSPSGDGDWRAGGRPETPLFDSRLDPDTILAAKGRSPATANRLSDYSTPSEESLGSLQDHQDYSRRVLQVTNPS